MVSALAGSEKKHTKANAAAIEKTQRRFDMVVLLSAESGGTYELIRLGWIKI
jgi:hypothetical protein